MSEDKITEPSVAIEPFKQDTDKWEIYQIELEEYFTTRNITDDKQKKEIFFHVVGPEICSLLRRLFDPVDPADISFSLICSVLNSYFGSLREDTESTSNDAETEKSEKAKKIAKTVGISVGVGLAVGGLTVVAAPFIAGAALTAVGFGSGGVIAGSMAAAAQSIIGNVAAGSIFAVLQSAGAAGIAASTAAGIGAGAGLAAAGTAAGVTSALLNKTDGEDKKETPETPNSGNDDEHSK